MDAKSILTLSRREALFGASALLLSGPAIARRSVPDDNLAYPVLISLRLKNGLTNYGSGFYFNAADGVYLVTARHVLFPPQPGDQKIELLDANVELMSYSKEISTEKRIVLSASLSALNAIGKIKAHPLRDVAVLKIADTIHPTMNLNYTAGISINAPKNATLLGVPRENIKLYDEVLVGNDVILYGYPLSLVQPDKNSKLDPLRPLLRRGLIAGLNDSRRTIILDCPVYRGNSGGPAVEIEPEDLQEKLRIIGVATEFVPLIEGAEDFLVQFNSGYSIVEPMDGVLELIPL